MIKRTQASRTLRPQARPWRGRILIVLLVVLLGCGWTSPQDDADFADNDYVYNDQVYPCQPGWYHGVLHSHAWYDDGEAPTPIGGVVAIAEAQGFDFLAITNHNTVFQWSNLGYYSTRLTMLYGVEWSSGKGHANIWSDEPFDWDAIAPTAAADDAEEAIRLTHIRATSRHPLLFSINHPNRMKNGLPSWRYPLAADVEVDAMEAWNVDDLFLSPTDLFTDCLARGRKITMVGGSDAHLKGDGEIPAFTERLGRPTTWVYADSRSGRDILMGIKQGHVFVSAGREGPRLAFTAGSSPDLVMMGDSISAEDLGTPVNFTVNVSGAGVPCGVVVIKNGMARESWSQTFSAPDNTLSFTDTPHPGDYYRVEIRQPTSLPVPFDDLVVAPLSALSNPIYTW